MFKFLKNNIIIFLVIILSILFLLKISSAAIINVTSCSYVDVSSAINSANAGDEINIPAGDCVWNNQLVITKGITLQGAGIGNTKITSNYSAVRLSETANEGNYLILYKPSNPSLNEPFRLSGFTFDFNNITAGVMLKNYITTIINKIRIDHNVFQNAAARNILVKGTVYGVVDNNTFDGGGETLRADGMQKDSWDNLTPYIYGTADNLYFEDNIISQITTNQIFFYGESGGRYVSRYNTFNWLYNGGLYPWNDMHGNQGTNNIYGTIGAEIYGNILTAITKTNADVNILDHRGGKALAFYNKAVTTGTVFLRSREEYDDSLNPTTSLQPQHVSDSYYWNNRKNNTLITATEGSDCCNAIAENSEFYNHNISFNGTVGMGCGTLATRPATCTAGVGYWATDQSCSSLDDINIGANPTTPISGTLYKCAASDIWTSYYTPYIYPHPLRAEAASQSDTISPSSPTGLMVQ